MNKDKEFCISIVNKVFNKNLDVFSNLDIRSDLSNYEGPDRHYHNYKHIRSMLSGLKNFDLTSYERNALILAIVFHDVDENELSCANRVYNYEFFCDYGTNFDVLVESLILSTCHFPNIQILELLKDFDKNHPEYVRLQHIIHDLDLEILSSDNYKEYSEAIRKEYYRYDDTTYYRGRWIILNQFLAMDKIYLTLNYSGLENKARKNIKNEIKEIEALGYW